MRGIYYGKGLKKFCATRTEITNGVFYIFKIEMF